MPFFPDDLFLMPFFPGGFFFSDFFPGDFFPRKKRLVTFFVYFFTVTNNFIISASKQSFLNQPDMWENPTCSCQCLGNVRQEPDIVSGRFSRMVLRKVEKKSSIKKKKKKSLEIEKKERSSNRVHIAT